MSGRYRKGANGYGFAAVFGAQGRIGRLQFAVSVVYQTMLSGLVGAVVMIFAGGPLLSAGADGVSGLIVFGVIATAAELATTTLLFLSIKARLNDIGVSNWWTVPMSVPTLVWLAGATFYDGLASDIIQSIGEISSIAMLGLLCAVPGTDGVNAYGEAPKSPAAGGVQPRRRPPALN